jgi:hypothetical protein
MPYANFESKGFGLACIVSNSYVGITSRLLITLAQPWETLTSCEIVQCVRWYQGATTIQSS